MTDEQLSALLRIKRFEQPPPQYFDRLLQDVHRRQRAELLRQPLWKIAAERVQTFFSEHSMGHLSYAGAMASVLIVGVGAIGIFTSAGPSSAPLARNGEASAQAATTLVAANSPAPAHALRLQRGNQASPLLAGPQQPALSHGDFLPASSRPRYVIDARPVSYEPSAVRF